MTNENSLKNLNMFSSTNQPKNNGRKPSQLKKYIKENNVSREDVGLLIKNVLFNKSSDELLALVQDNKTPMVIRLLIKAFLADFKKGSLYNFNILMDRAYGTPKQDITVEGQIDVMQMTTKEREDLINGYIEKYQSNMPGSDDTSDRQDSGLPGDTKETIKKES